MAAHTRACRHCRKVAMRSRTGMKSADPYRLTAETKSRNELVGRPSFHDGRGLSCASAEAAGSDKAAVEASRPARICMILPSSKYTSQTAVIWARTRSRSKDRFPRSSLRLLDFHDLWQWPFTIQDVFRRLVQAQEQAEHTIRCRQPIAGIWAGCLIVRDDDRD